MKQLHSDRNICFFVYIFKCKKRNVGSKIIQEKYTYPNYYKSCYTKRASLTAGSSVLTSAYRTNRYLSIPIQQITIHKPFPARGTAVSCKGNCRFLQGELPFPARGTAVSCKGNGYLYQTGPGWFPISNFNVSPFIICS